MVAFQGLLDKKVHQRRRVAGNGICNTVQMEVAARLPVQEVKACSSSVPSVVRWLSSVQFLSALALDAALTSGLCSLAVRLGPA